MDLTDRDIEELDSLLEATPKPLEPLDVVTLDGYLCAVLVQPRLIGAAEWLPDIFDVHGRSLPADVDPVWRERVATLAQRRHAALNGAIAEEGWFEPLIPVVDDGPDEGDATVDPGPALAAPPSEAAKADPRAAAGAAEAGVANAAAQSEAATTAGTDALRPWVAGFDYGLARFPHLFAWLESATSDDDEERSAGNLALLRILRHQEPLDDDDRALHATLDRDYPLASVDDAIDDVVQGVADLWDVTQPERYRVEPRRHDTAKVGRNDPCPCGSGRKYKRCHGA